MAEQFECFKVAEESDNYTASNIVAKELTEVEQYKKGMLVICFLHTLSIPKLLTR